MSSWKRSHHLGELRKEHEGQDVALSGWVHHLRDLGPLVFITLRDRFGLTQVLFDSKQFEKAYAQAKTLHAEWVIHVKGKVQKRAQPNTEMATGDIEVLAQELNILSEAAPMPFNLNEKGLDVNEETRLTYRYLDLRRPYLTEKLVLRHRLMQSTRNFLDHENFLEIQTPILAKSTPEGARDYLVPSRIYEGKFYALPQSPQIFKQLLMVAGLDRYFQIATCFRDEDLRADRQPEFTQIDLEMSFSDPQTLFELIERLCNKLLQDCIAQSVPTPFKTMTYAQCLEDYGCDKPDLRFEMKLKNLSSLFANSSFDIGKDLIAQGAVAKGLNLKTGASLSRKKLDGYLGLAKTFGLQGLAPFKLQEGILSGPLVKFLSEEAQQTFITTLEMEEGDCAFVAIEKPPIVNQCLDHLRRALANDFNLIDDNRYEFLWVVDFPLFQYDEEEQRLVSEHHPFTHPLEDDLHLLDKDPLKVRSCSYDLVLNGYEIASGSQRIHSSKVQSKIFELLKLSEAEQKERFGFFINALRYGTPPHLGIALGLDRLVMILSKTQNIRDVIAFPKTQKASDLMMEAPSSVDSQQLHDLSLSIESSS